jgi:HEAT repeat protein
MNIVLDLLREGDLRTDGLANDVVREVRANPGLLELLMEGLESADGAVRGHTADALEKVSRTHPLLLARHLPLLIEQALGDPVAMVRWHLAMILGTLGALGQSTEVIVSALCDLVSDRSAFVRSWALAGLAQIGCQIPAWKGEMVPFVGPLLNDRSIAVRTRAAKALAALEGRAPMPEGWVKCQLLKEGRA